MPRVALHLTTRTPAPQSHIAIYVDLSNVFITGQAVSAVRKGWSTDVVSACTSGQWDRSWRVDFWKLRRHLLGSEAARPVRTAL